MSNKNRFLVVDDHALIREGLIRTLKDILEFPAQFDEATTAKEAINKISDGQYHLVLLDISLPDQNGLNLLKTLKVSNPNLPVVMVSTHPDEHYAARSLRAGAAGYINKGCNSSMLKEVIVRAMEGKRSISSVQSDLLIESYGSSHSKKSVEKLSDRELQLVHLISSGKTLTSIANDLNISVKTVSSYRSRILEKLQLKSTADIIRYSMDNNL